MSPNVHNPEDREDYFNRMYTPNGMKVLNNHLENLAKEYAKRKDEEYPFRFGLILGLPMSNPTMLVKSKDELLGRIKVLMQILGHRSVDISDERCIKILKLEE